MFDLDRWTEIADALRTNKLRTILTALGVFWGMFMLVVMLGFGAGLERGVKKSMMGFATNAVYVWGGRTSMPYEGMRPGRYIGFDNDDYDALRNVPGIEFLAPRNQLGGYREGANAVRGVKTGNYTIYGDVPAYRHIAAPNMIGGRFLNDLDLSEYRKVCVIGDQVVTELFAGDDPIGEYIQIRGVFFQVVGWAKSPAADDRADRDNSTIQVPFTTFQRTFNYGDEVGWFAMTGEADLPGSELEKRVKSLLGKRHDVHPDDTEAVGSFNAEEEFGKITTLFAGIRFFVWFVGVMTLAAGIVGVSNILLIVVRERTKEIGLRRALGATPFSVVAMILQESVTLTAVAGYAGLVTGVVILELVGLAVGPDNPTMGQPSVDLSTALAAGAVLLVAGAVAGVIPARNAVAIQPVEALHAE